MIQIGISPREKEVLDLIADENSSKMITKELFISEHTVITHRKNLMTKLNASNTAGLVKKAYETGLLRLSRQMALFVLLVLSVSSVNAQQTVIEHNSSFANPHIELREESDAAAIISFRNDQFAANRFFMRADPSGTSESPAIMSLGWLNLTDISERREYIRINASTDEIQLNGSDVTFDLEDDPDGPMLSIVDAAIYYNHTRSSFRGGHILFSNAWALDNLGLYSFGYGTNAAAIGGNSAAFGAFNRATGFASSAFGNATSANAYASTTVGMYNDPIVFEGADLQSDQPMFIVGNGSTFDRSNAFVVYRDGVVEVNDNLEVETEVVIGSADTPAGNPLPTLTVGGVTISSTGIGGGMTNRLTVNNNIIPDDDNLHGLGESGARWTEVWAVDGTINTSDRRAKKNIDSSNYGLQDVLQLNPVMYNWKKENDNDAKTIGLIAQEILDVIPEVVRVPDNEEDLMGVKYSELIPVLIKAIQEQQTIIDTQHDEMASMKAMISRFDSDLSGLSELLKNKTSYSE